MASRKVADIYAELQLKTAQFKAALGEATNEMRRFSAETKAQTHEAKASVALLGEEIGVRLPRHLRGFVVGLPGVAAAMSAAFNTVAVVGLITVVVEAGKRVYEFFAKNEEAAKKNDEAWHKSARSINEINHELDVNNERIQAAIAKLEKKPGNGLKLALIESADAAHKLGEKLDDDIDKVIKLNSEQKSSFLGRLFSGSKNPLMAEGAGALAQMQDVIRSYGEVIDRSAESGDRANVNRTQDEMVNRLGVIGNPIVAKLDAWLRSRQNLAGKGNAEFDQISDLRNIIVGAVTAEAGEGRLNLSKQREGSLKDSPTSADTGLAGPILGRIHPILDAIKAWQKEQAEYAKDEANAAKEEERKLAPAWDKWIKRQEDESAAGSMGTFGRNDPRAVYSGPGAAAQGAKNALDELARSFTDTAALIHDTIINTLNEFNNTLTQAITGKHADWRGMVRGVGQGIVHSGLQRAEGYALSALGFGKTKRDGSSAASALYVINATGMPGTAVPGVGGLLGKMNDSDKLGKLFGGRLFGAGGIFGHFASGGDVPGGVAIDVGELGPERFVTPGPGKIVPNKDVGRSTINIDARQTDPALTHLAVARGMALAHKQSVQDAQRNINERSKRTPR